jgi:hypothetical protein
MNLSRHWQSIFQWSAVVCDTSREGVLIPHELSRMGQDVYRANYATNRLSHFRSDICGHSALCAATLCFLPLYADSLQVGIVIIRSELSASLEM